MESAEKEQVAVWVDGEHLTLKKSWRIAGSLRVEQDIRYTVIHFTRVRIYDGDIGQKVYCLGRVLEDAFYR